MDLLNALNLTDFCETKGLHFPGNGVRIEISLICDLSTEMLSHAKCGGEDTACSHPSLKMMILLANKTSLQGSRDQSKACIGNGQIVINMTFCTLKTYAKK